MDLCKCGCGFQPIDGNEYIHGHNRRDLASYTSGDKWSMDYDKCINCGTINRKHVGKGLCVKCYRLARYELKKQQIPDKWSKKYDKCINCGRIDRPHHANGRCGTCHVNNLNRKKGKPKRNFGAWSWYYDKCQICGTVDRPHAAKGLCEDCYEEIKRDLSKVEVCPICKVKVVKLNQHLSMRAKKCKKHKKYQYDRLKIYFDSDLNLDDISKELNMGRHSVTRQFIKYFGEKEANSRNESVRRCNISEKAVINHNYRNMYGTVMEYDSPNQGKIKLRSKLEAQYAKELDNSGIDWFYEKESFQYIGRDGKRRTYTPDFYLPDEDRYVEIKGNNLLDELDLHKINWVCENAGVDIEIKIMN